jgi:hypothetical protein
MVDTKQIDGSGAVTEENPRILAGHQDYMGDPRRVKNVGEVSIGDVIEFTYEAAPRVVFVLNPNYQLQLHGFSLRQLDHRTLKVEVVDKMLPTDTPLQFYQRVVTKPNIAKIDAYRTYDVRKMGNITIRPYKLNG